MKTTVHDLRGKNGDEPDSFALRSVCRQLQVSGACHDGRRGLRA